MSSSIEIKLDTLIKTVDELQNEIKKLNNRVEFLQQYLTEDVKDYDSKNIATDPVLDVSIISLKENELSFRASNVLLKNRYHTVRDLTYLSFKKIKRLRGCGESISCEIEELMNSRGLHDESDIVAIPEFHVGETVVLRTVDISRSANVGAVAMITEIMPKPDSAGLPMYVLTNGTDKKIMASPGMLCTI